MSDQPKKKRADSKIGTLPAARQEQIAELCATKTLVEVREQLAADGLHVSLDTISRWYSSWQLEQDFARTDELVQRFQELTRQNDPGISQEKLFNHGQTMFALLAMENKDPLSWKRVQDVGHRRQLVELETQKFQRETAEMFLKWSEDRRAQDIAASSGLGQSEKIERLGQLMFGEDWAPPTSASPKEISP